MLRNAPAEKAKVATIRVVTVPFPNPSINSPIVSLMSRLRLNDPDGVDQIGDKLTGSSEEYREVAQEDVMRIDRIDTV